MKRCNRCLTNRPGGEFSRRVASPDGLNYTCRACAAERCRAWRAQNPGAFSEASWRSWYEQNKEARAASHAAWARENKHVINALVAKRNAAKRNATPSWVDMERVREFYERAAFLTQATGVRHEVDHIYPLQGELVCGLHCEANLQILTKSENIRKSNRMPEEVVA